LLTCFLLLFQCRKDYFHQYKTSSNKKSLNACTQLLVQLIKHSFYQHNLHIYVHVQLYIQTHIHAYTDTYIPTCTYMHVYMRPYMQLSVHTREVSGGNALGKELSGRKCQKENSLDIHRKLLTFNLTNNTHHYL